ncbi:Na(+)/H(+) antiporter subunit C [Pseudokineococcus basanitobsidens]|uniref:Na(+)/H(+) antiporter subunit C n=1 Tax=Pseudokineococcus basanitobsidens TaxID=1926649 RepID=A0ABU8RM01_9ACTN
MSPALVLVAVVFVLVATGVYLLLERSLTRVLVGVVLVGNGINVLFLVASGRAGGPALVGVTPEDEMSDPLPQAFVLTAVVITLGLTAFLLAMAYRSWQLHGHDEVQDDVEDRLIVARAVRDEMSGSYDPEDDDGDPENPVEERSEDDRRAHASPAPSDDGRDARPRRAPRGTSSRHDRDDHRDDHRDHHRDPHHRGGRP